MASRLPFFMVLFLFVIVSGNEKVKKKSRVLTGNGTFEIAAVIPIFGKNYTINYSTGIMAYYGLKIAIDIHNELLNQTIFGYQFKLVDTFTPDPESTRKSLDVMYYLADVLESNVSFIIGPRLTSEAILYDTVLYTAKVPVYSYGASSSFLDGLATHCSNNLRSSIPSDTFRFQALIDTIKDVFQWNYFAIIGSHGIDGGSDALAFSNRAKKQGLCMATLETLSKLYSDEELESIIKSIDTHVLNTIATRKVKAVLLFTKDEDSKRILKALKKLKLEKRFMLVFFYASISNYEVVRGYEDVALDSVSIDFDLREIKYFRDRYLSMNPENTKDVYFHLFWEQLFQCRLNHSDVLKETKSPVRKEYNRSCSGKEKLEKFNGYYYQSLAARLGDMLDYLASGVHHFLAQRCRRCAVESKRCWYPGAKQCPFEPSPKLDKGYRQRIRALMCSSTFDNRFILPVSKSTRRYLPFFFDIYRFVRLSNGEYYNSKVVRWTHEHPYENRAMSPEESMDEGIRKINYYRRRKHDFENYTGLAVCSDKCNVGYTFKNHSSMGCCWECIKCPKNNIVRNNKCIPCKIHESTNERMDKCMPLPVVFVIPSVEHPMVFVIIGASGIGFLSVIVVMIVFVLHNRNHVVRASGRDLSYSILIGVVALFVCPFSFLTKPTPAICAFRDILPNLSFLLCYAALSLKVGRIYRIFRSAESRVSRPVFVSPKSQIAILFGIVVIQLLVNSVWFLLSSPEPVKILSENERFVTLHCDNSRNFAKYFVNLVPTIAFMLLCTYVAFKTRNFPKNYNEAKYIGITLYVSFVMWCVFIVTFCWSSSIDTFASEYAISVLCVVIGLTTLTGLFSHKLILLYKRKPLEDHHDSLKSRARSLSSRSSHRDINVNETGDDHCQDDCM